MRKKVVQRYGLLSLCLLSIFSLAFILFEVNGTPVAAYTGLIEDSTVYMSKDAGFIRYLIFSLVDSFIL